MSTAAADLYLRGPLADLVHVLEELDDLVVHLANLVQPVAALALHLLHLLRLDVPLLGVLVEVGTDEAASRIHSPADARQSGADSVKLLGEELCSLGHAQALDGAETARRARGDSQRSSCEARHRLGPCPRHLLL